MGALAASVVGALAALTMLTSCDDSKSTTESKVFDFTGQSLVIDARETALVIDHGASSQITVERTLKGNASEPGKATLALEDGVLKTWVECSGVTFSCEGSHTVHVPPGVAVELKGSGTSVRGDGLSGDLTAELSNDATITLNAPSGALDLQARGGGITVTDAKSPTVNAVVQTDGNVSLGFATAPQSVKATSTGGSAEVALPSGQETYRVDAGALEGLVSDPASGRTVLVQAGEGRATVTKAG